MTEVNEPAGSKDGTVSAEESPVAANDRLWPDLAASGMNWKRDAALAALLTAPTIVEAARTAGVGERTLRRWLADPGFAAEYDAACRQAFNQAIFALQQASGEAVATLRRNLNCGNPAVEVRAASEILAQAAQWQELHDLGDRVAALEEDAATRGPAWG